MQRSDIKALYYICHIENLPSIMQKGIACYNRAQKLKHNVIHDPSVQERRKNKQIPGGGKLHDYANLYFNPRNAMMYKRKDLHREICILTIDPKILNATSVVISDMNASSDYARFYSPKDLDKLDEKLIFAKDWTHRDPIEYFKRKSAVCAEVLVPNFVPSSFINGIYVSCNESRENVKRLLVTSPLHGKVIINNDLFFQW